MTSVAQRERAALSDLFEQLGPDAPTLCGDWSTRDLAAHLIVREGDPAAAGIVVGPLSGWTEHRRTATARKEYADLVEKVRSGPPVWSPLRLSALDSMVNTVEFFVHLEDVRRAQPGWEPRSLDPRQDAVLWQALTSRAQLFLRRSPVGVTLLTPDGRRCTGRKGTPSVTLVGEPAELLMYVHGRTDHALVEIQGDPDAVATFRTTPLAV